MNRAPFAIAVMLLSCLAGAEPATLLRPTELKMDPASDAPTIAPLAEKAKVDVLERKGGWTRVKTEAGAEGWVKMLVLRYSASGATKEGDGGVAGAVDAARGGASGAAATTGVRGLDPAMLASAQPNRAELKKMEAFAATKESAASFAASASLQPQSIAYPKEAR
jgi:hypothetical protein